MIVRPHTARSWRVRAAVVTAVACAACLAVPAGWAVVRTVDAGQGEETPIAAANAYLLATFQAGGGTGVDRCLCDAHRSELLRQVDRMRDEVAASGADIKIEAADWTEGDPSGTVSARVNFRFTYVDPANGRVTFIKGTSHEWRFKTKKERGIQGGWKVCRVDAPELCGNHLRC